ncbi:MAG: glycosyltransferase family 2 protein [Verrucomicrobia bacterium]|nr:glycosyltransferase family 2 protein [Verrucomicrobiota bacterium]MCH8514227.1 glycosyltransferase family 2 protein [Kiritimatiellia bacterium]
MSKNTGSVSVVVPTHNHGRFLAEAVKSVLAQTVPAHEVLIVDDGSTDETPAVIQGFGNAVKSIRVEGRGAYGARNDSLPHLSGDYFLNVDADNRLRPDYIEKTLAVLRSAPERVGYVYTQRSYFGDESGVSAFPDFDPALLPLRNFVDMGALIRMDLVKGRGFDETFNRGRGDHAFFLSLLRDGWVGQRLDEPLLEYRVHSDSITGRVRRRYDQPAIVELLIQAFPELYPPEVAREARDEARNRVLLSVIANRRPDAPARERLRDFLAFSRAGFRHAEWPRQFAYLLNPRRTTS